jgi:hypothetical protein
MEHDKALPRPNANGRYRFSQETFAGRSGNERDAPIPVIPREPGFYPHRQLIRRARVSGLRRWHDARRAICAG